MHVIFQQHLQNKVEGEVYHENLCQLFESFMLSYPQPSCHMIGVDTCCVTKDCCDHQNLLAMVIRLVARTTSVCFDHCVDLLMDETGGGIKRSSRATCREIYTWPTSESLTKIM